MKTLKINLLKTITAGSFLTFTLFGGTAQAAPDTWTGATSANWLDSNWSGANNPPSSGDSLIFTSATGTGGTALNNNLTSSAFNLAGINFSSGAAAFSISGNAFALIGAITNSSSSLESISDPFSLSAVTNFTTLAGGGNLSLAGNISGSGGGIAVLGSGIVKISGTNSYTGATTVSGATLLVGNGLALPGTTTVNVTNGGTLDLGGNSVAITGFGIGTAISVITNSASGPAAITVSNLNVNLKTLVADGANGPVAFNFINAAAVNVSGGYLSNNTNTFSGGLTIGNAVSGSGYTRLGLSSTTVNQGVPGNITNSLFGRGTITIGQAATDRAQIYVSVGGATVLNNVVFNTAVGADRAGAFRVDGSGLILAGTLTANVAPVSFSCNSSANTALLTGQITGTNGFWLKVNGSSPNSYIICTMSNVTANANNYQGGNEIDNPFILAFGAPNQIPNGASAGDVTNNGTIRFNGNSQTFNGLWGTGTNDGISGTPTLTVGANNETSTLNGIIKNSGGTLSLTKIGSGTFTVNGITSYSGNTTVNGGTLTLGNPFLSSTSVVSIASSAVLNLPGGGSYVVGGLVLNGVAQPSGTYNATTTPAYISGSGQLVVEVGGAAADVWTGTTSANWSQSNWSGGNNPPITGDAVNFGSATGVGGTSLNDDLTSPTFDLGGINFNTGAAAFTVNGNSFALTGPVLNNSAVPETINDSFTIAGTQTYATTNASGSLTLGGSITGLGGITVAGLGTLDLTGNNNYSGPTTVAGGTLLIGNPSALPAATLLTLTTGGIVDLSSNGATIANFGAGDLTGVITNSASGTNVSTLTLSSWSAGLNTLVADGATAPVALNLESVGNVINCDLANNNNTFSGGLTIGNAATGSGYARFQLAGAVPVTTGVPGNIISSPFGRGTITIGNYPSDKAQWFLDTDNTNVVSVLNNIVINTSLGADRVGALRVDQNTVIFAGTLTGNQAPVNFGCNSAQTNAAILTGQVTGPYGLWLQYNGSAPAAILTVTLSNLTANANNYQGDTEVDAPHVLVLGAANQIPSGVNAGNLNLNGTFDLNGYNQTINGLEDSSTNGIVDGISGTPILTVGDNDADSEFDGVIQNSGGRLSLTKIGAGGLYLTGINTYTGTTTVNDGTLEIAQPYLATNSTVTVATGATLQLDFAVTNTVASLNLGGVIYTQGVFNSATSPSLIAGPGSLQVVSASILPNTPTNITYTISGKNLTISWPSSYLGWILQEQTNALNVGIQTSSNAWFDVPGTASVTSTNLTISPSIPTVFYRLSHP